MQLHARATLTVENRKEVKRLHAAGVSIRKLAERFHVTPKTIHYWVRRDSPLDKTSAPLKHRTTITPDYRQAVVAYRQAHPSHGPITIASALIDAYPQSKKGTIHRILQEEGLVGAATKRRRSSNPIPVGRHRIQMDIQALPAVKGEKKREYKVSLIHLATRVKYSEICPNHRSETVVDVFKRALDYLPPFF
jgi:hypothetical protein